MPLQSLVLHIGNSTTSLALFNKNSIEEVIKSPTNEFLENNWRLINFINSYSTSFFDLTISSVVREIKEFLLREREKIKFRRLYVLQYTPDLPIKINYREPEKLGPDRIAHCLYIRELVKENSVTVDLGTAITINFIDKYGNFFGGFILPGFNISLEALHQTPAKLPKVGIPDKKIVFRLGDTTENGMVLGCYFGLTSAIKNLTKFGILSLDWRNPRKFVTGGSTGFKNYLRGFEFVENLTLVGANFFKNYSNAL